MWCFFKKFVVYETKIFVCGHFYWAIVIWHFEISYKHVYPIFLTEKDLSLETFNSPQF